MSRSFLAGGSAASGAAAAAATDDEATDIGQPTLSRQLAALRRAELVRTRRAAKLVYYCLANENVALCVRSIEAIFGSGRDV
jgi:DNA-binding transcriptional ArsR family regulator